MTQDSNKELIRMLLDRVHPRPIVRTIILVAYEVNYDKISDGITFMHELAFRGFHMKNPFGVGHDLLYALGKQSPFLPMKFRTNFQARSWADQWLYDGLYDYGHLGWAPTFWYGVRLGGWVAWRSHRRKGHPSTELARAVTCAWRKISMETGE